MTALDRLRGALELAGRTTRDGGKTWTCPAHEDRTPSLSVSQGDQRVLLLCRAGCRTEDVLATLRLEWRDLFDGEPVARVREESTPAPRVESLGAPTEAQVLALARARRVLRRETLAALGVVRVRCYGKDWLGIPALAGSWKLWALDADGRPRLADGKLVRRNVGPASLVLRVDTAAPVERLYDVEGESDLIACVEAGLALVVCGIGGASSLAGHERHRDELLALGAREVAIIGDLDDAGRAGATKRAEWWRAQGVPTRLVELPAELGDKGDLRDYLNGRPARNGSPALEPLGDACDLDQLATLAALVESEPAPGSVTVADMDEPDQEADALIFPTAAALRGTFAAVVELLQPVTGAAQAHVFAATWAAVATCIGAARWGSWSGRVVTPVYALCVGPTGDHKSSAMDRVTELLPESVRRVDGATSDAGLFDALEDAAGSSVLLHYDELAFLLKMAGISGQTLDAMLNRLWGAPPRLERRLSKRNRDGGARSVERPLVSMLAGTHSESFWRHLEDPELAIASGFVNRLTPFCVERGRSLSMTREPDDQAAAAIRAHLVRLAALDRAHVTLEPRAEALWTEYATEHDRRISELGYPRNAVTKRLRDHVARLALVYATDASRFVVETDDLLAAIAVGAYIEASYGRLLAGRAPGRGPERAAGIEDTIRSLLAKRRGVTCSVRDLQRSWPWEPRPGSAELARALEAMDDIETVDVPGARKRRYRLTRPGPYPTPDTQPREIASRECRVSGEASASRMTEARV